MTDRRVRAACTSLLLGGLLAGCTLGDGAEPVGDPGPAAAAPVTMPIPGPGEILILDREGAFAAYDPRTGRIGQTSDADGYFAYEFGSHTGQVTAGSSEDGGYAAMRREGAAWTTEAEVPAGESLLPLAADGDRTFFVRAPSAEPDARTIVRLEGDRLVPVMGPASRSGLGLVLSGALLGDALYVSSYVEEDDAFELRVLRPDADDVAGTVRLLDEPLADAELLADGERVWGRTERGFRVVAGDARPELACRGHCSMVPGRELMLDWWRGPGQPRLRVVDTRDGAETALLRGVLDFQLRDEELTVYGTTGRSVQPLSELLARR